MFGLCRMHHPFSRRASPRRHNRRLDGFQQGTQRPLLDDGGGTSNDSRVKDIRLKVSSMGWQNNSTAPFRNGWQNNPFGFADFAHCQTAVVRWAGVHFRIRIRLAKDKRFILKMQLCCLAQEVKIKLTKIDRKIDRGAFDDVFTNIRLKRPQQILEKERCDRFFCLSRLEEPRTYADPCTDPL